MLAKFSTLVWIFSSWTAVQLLWPSYNIWTLQIHFYRRFSGGSLVKIYLKKFFTIKGQIMSQCIYEITDFPKYHRKNLIDFCPGRFYRQGTCDLFWLYSRRLYSGECRGSLELAILASQLTKPPKMKRPFLLWTGSWKPHQRPPEV